MCGAPFTIWLLILVAKLETSLCCREIKNRTYRGCLSVSVGQNSKLALSITFRNGKPGHTVHWPTEWIDPVIYFSLLLLASLTLKSVGLGKAYRAPKDL